MRDEEGFRAFVDAQLPRLLGFGRVLTGNDHDAWDLTQEALTRMGQRWSRIDASGNAAAYARTTMVRLNVDRLRSLGRTRPVGAVPELLASEPPDVEPWLLDALRALSVRQRTALVLRYVEDLDHRGIADAMGCSVGTARSHVSHALAALRTAAPDDSSLTHLDTGGTP